MLKGRFEMLRNNTKCVLFDSTARVWSGPVDLRPVCVEQDVLHPAALPLRHARRLRGRHRRGGVQWVYSFIILNSFSLLTIQFYIRHFHLKFLNNKFHVILYDLCFLWYNILLGPLSHKDFVCHSRPNYLCLHVADPF